MIYPSPLPPVFQYTKLSNDACGSASLWFVYKKMKVMKTCALHIKRVFTNGRHELILLCNNNCFYTVELYYFKIFLNFFCHIVSQPSHLLRNFKFNFCKGANFTDRSFKLKLYAVCKQVYTSLNGIYGLFFFFFFAL